MGLSFKDEEEIFGVTRDKSLLLKSKRDTSYNNNEWDCLSSKDEEEEIFGDTQSLGFI